MTNLAVSIVAFLVMVGSVGVVWFAASVSMPTLGTFVLGVAGGALWGAGMMLWFLARCLA